MLYNYVLEPTIQEIKETIKKRKNGKSTGKVEIAAELLKSEGKELYKMIHVLILKAWKEEKIPAEWHDAIIVPIQERKCKKM